MIESFGDRVTSDLYHGIKSNRVRRLPPQIQRLVVQKLDIVNAAQEIDDLRSPPGNRLELLKGKLSGFYSIRINAQWRIIFQWQASNANNVKLIDYH